MEHNEQNVPVVSVSEWLVSLLLMIIPLVNIVLLFVWAFGDTNPNRSNWAKASLILMAISIVFYIIIFAVFGAFWMSYMS